MISRVLILFFFSILLFRCTNTVENFHSFESGKWIADGKKCFSYRESVIQEMEDEFEKLIGVPVLINTSFNIRGEPIVNTPYDAYRCMMGTGIDGLVMGNFFIKRKDNSKDYWNSEKYAKD